MFRGETWVWRGGRADLVWVPDTETMRWWRGHFQWLLLHCIIYRGGKVDPETAHQFLNAREKRPRAEL